MSLCFYTDRNHRSQLLPPVIQPSVKHVSRPLSVDEERVLAPENLQPSGEDCTGAGQGARPAGRDTESLTD